MASLSGVFNLQEFSDLGELAAGYRLYTYAPGTTTLKIAYTDAAGTIPHTYTNDGLGGQYIALNARGELPAPLFLLVGGYDITLKTDLGVTVWTRRAIGGGDTGADLANTTDATKGAGLVGWNPALDYPVGTVGDRLRAWVRPQDFGGTPGGAVDATSYLQQALDSGQPVLIDEVFLTSGNEVPSGTVLVFHGRGKLKLADNANRPVLQNTNWNKAGWGGATYGIDRDIYIEGLSIDGNDANQVHHLTTGPYAGEYVSGVRFFGVTNLKITNSTISKTRTFGIWCAAILNGTFHNIRFDQTMTGTPDNQDGLHINGPALNLDIRNIFGSTNDDMVALNADDGALGANVTAGDIRSALIDGVYPVACLNGVRLLSATSRMDQITVRSVKGSTRDVAVNQSPYGLGAGNVGTLTIDDIDVRCSNPFQPTTSYYYAMISLDGIIENVSLTNIKNNRPDDNRATLIVAGTANIGVLSIDGMTIFESGTSTITGVRPIVVFGLIDTMTVRGVQYFRDSLLTKTGNLLRIDAPGKGVTNLSCSDWVTQRLVIPIELVDGLLGNVTLVNIEDRDGLSGFSLLALNSASGATTNVDMLNCSTGTGRKLVSRSNLSVFGSRVAIDKAGASGASAALPANQALTAATYTKLNFATETYDRIGEFDTATQAFTVTQGPGTYQLHCSVDLTIPTNPTTIVLALYKGGVLYRVLDTRVFTSDSTVVASALVSVAQGDVFDVRLFVSAAATAKISNSTTVFYERLK